MISPQIVFHFLSVHQIKTTEILRINVICLLALFQRVRVDLWGRNFLELKADFVVPCRFIDICTKPNDGLKNMQLLLLIKQLPLFNNVLGRLVVGEEIFLIDGCQIRIVKMIRDLLLVYYFLSLLFFKLVLCQLFSGILASLWLLALLFNVLLFVHDYKIWLILIVKKWKSKTSICCP